MTKTLNNAFLLGMLIAAGTAQAAGAGPAKQSVDRAEAARVEKSQSRPAPRSVVVPTATVTYSGTTVGSPTYARTLSDCSGLSGVGTAVNYSVQPFNVDTAGAYDIHSEQSYDAMIFLYSGSFDPSNAMTNCVTGNDDNGTNVSDIVGATLATGTNYFVVTASFGNGESGTFENTISGPGNIAMPRIALTKTTPGVAVNGNFDYTLDLQNPGSTNETITVTDVLPAGLTYVSNTCGGTFASGTFTWNAGLINSGAGATCALTVNNPIAACPKISNTANATTVSGLSATSTTSNDTLFPDPSLESSGAGGSEWASTSTNFNTVLCDAGCANDPTFVPADGSWWAWFAGADPASATQTFPEIGTLSQSVTIPAGVTQLQFKLRVAACGGVAADFIALRIDGTEVFRVDGTDARCGETDYVDEAVNIAAYANGAAHTIEFYSEQTNTGTGVTNFFVDVIGFDVGVCALSDAIFANGFEVEL